MTTPLLADGVALSWIPLGAGPGGGLVRSSGWAFERLAARRDHRPPAALFHSALEVRLDGTRHVIEMTPAWGRDPASRGVVCQGPVGLDVLGRSRFFRYEVRRWAGGVVPDIDHAVGPARRLGSDPSRARLLLDLVPSFPTATWGRDEQDTGDMWNSNSLTAWLLARSGHDTDDLVPAWGRAPGWHAGLAVAGRAGVPLVG